jgi:hypothetical protein
MGWQEILVLVAVSGAVAYILWRIIRFFRRVSKNENLCDSCDADCALRDLKKKQGENIECPKENHDRSAK